MKPALVVAKKLLRKEIQGKIRELSAAEKENQSNAVLKKLFDLSVFKESKRISVYLSTNDEIDTKPILEKIFDDGKLCFIPRYDKNVMEMVRLNSMSDWENLPLTKWKIKQPLLDDRREDALETDGLDLIIVPGVGFTKNGERIGHGMGYYDMYIKKLRSMEIEPILIGLAFREQIIENIPIDDHDIPVDQVLYPN